MQNFTDIFKKSFLESYTNLDMDINRVMVTMFIAAILGLYIFITYRMVSRKTFYSKTFNNTLWVFTIITTGIILAIQSNLVISLGMVGALSIVRFRTAIKDPLDLAFLFWSISVGIIVGAAMYTLAIAMSIMITIGVVLLELLPVAKAPMLLVLNCDKIVVEKELMSEIKKFSRVNRVKSRTYTQDALDMIIEVRAKKQEELMKALAAQEGIISISLVAPDGEIAF